MTARCTNYGQSMAAASTTAPGHEESGDAGDPEQVELLKQAISAAMGRPYAAQEERDASLWKSSMSYLREHQFSNVNDATGPMHVPIGKTTLGQAQGLNQQQQALAAKLWIRRMASRNMAADQHGTV